MFHLKIYGWLGCYLVTYNRLEKVLSFIHFPYRRVLEIISIIMYSFFGNMEVGSTCGGTRTGHSDPHLLRPGLFVEN